MLFPAFEFGILIPLAFEVQLLGGLLSLFDVLHLREFSDGLGLFQLMSSSNHLHDPRSE